MSPEQMIAALDRQLAANGQTIGLRRGSTVHDLPASARGYTPAELQGGIQHGDSLVVLSPTHLAQKNLSGPVRLDVVVISGRARRVEFANPVEVRGVVVRYDLLVRG